MSNVHRFRDSVAIHVGDGSTVYMTPQEAQKLAKALNACARDIKAVSFANSQFSGVEVSASKEAHRHVIRKES